MLGRAFQKAGFAARRPLIRRADLVLGGGAFACALALGVVIQFGPRLAPLAERHGGWLVFCLLLLAFLISSRPRWTAPRFQFWRLARRIRRAHHDFANRFLVGPPRLIAHPFVLDGDTIDDLDTGVRYRLANIDAPETDGAQCGVELWFGLKAKAEAQKLIARAERVEVRRTWRTDRFGRRVAFVLIDGRDLGALLIARGLAHPWRGRREKWCGRFGSIKRLACRRRDAPSCAPCR